MLAPDAATDLESFADLFDGIAADADPARLPLLLKVEAGDPSVKDLAGQHPSVPLVGCEAPAAWSAVGVATVGWALPPERFDEADLDRHTFRTRPSRDPERVRVRSTVLADRTGAIAGRLTIGDGETLAEAPSSGFMVDVLLRVMGCPTPAPEVTTSELFAVLWLVDVVGTAREQGRRLPWREVEALHPAVRMLTAAGARRPGDDLEAIGRAFANVCGWSELRQQVIDRGWTGAGCSRAEARWLDEGSFARWAISRQPPLDEVVDRLDEAMAPASVRRVQAALRSWGLR